MNYVEIPNTRLLLASVFLVAGVLVSLRFRLGLVRDIVVEAMKLMNEIESDATGEIVRRFVQTGQPIEYGQPLFAVRTL